MSENIAKYNVILEVITETKGSDQVKKEVTGLQKQFQTAQKSFGDIISKEIVADATKGLESLKQKLKDVGEGQSLTPLIDRLQELTAKANLTETEFKELEVISEQLGKELANALPNAAGDFKELAANAEDTTTKFKTAKQELRQLTNLITSGELEGEDLKIATARAAALTDEIGDVREQIKNLSSDTRGIDTLIEGTRAVAAGFAIAEGAIAVFGDENEDVQKALVKLNGIMAIQNGLQEAHALLLQNSNLKMRAAAIAQGIYNVVVGTSSGALKLFRIALAATGLGLFVILLGTLVANWDKVKKSISENAQAMFDFAKKVTILAPPLNLLIRAGEYLYNNFEKVKTAIFGIDDAIGAFLSTTGTVLGKLTSGDFSGAIASFKSIGSETAKAFYEGQKEEQLRQRDLGLATVLENNSKLLERDIQRREALGKDAFDLEKKNAINQINILRLRKASKEEISDAEFKLELLLLNRQKGAEARQKKQDELNEAARKKKYDSEIEAVEKTYALQEQEALKTIKDADELALKLKQIETQKQIDLTKIKIKYSKNGTSDAIELENQLLELESKYNEFFQRAKADPLDLLPTKLKDDIVNNVEQIKGKIKELETQYNSAFGEESSGLQRIDIVEKIKAVRKEFESEVSKINSPKLNKLTFETGGFDAIDLDKLLPKDRVPALQNRLGLVTGAVEQVKAKLQAGLGDPLDLQAFDSLRDEGEKIIELLQRLGIEIPAMSEKIIKGTGDILGISPETLGLIQESVEVARDAFSTISDIYIGELDKRIEAQESRVESAEKIAEKGNVKQLEIEEERLAKLEEKRKEASDRAAVLQKVAAEAQIIINTALTISNLQVAAARSAAETGIAAPITVPIVLAIVGGLIASAANIFSPPAFIEGTELVQSDSRYGKFKKSNGQDGYTARFDGKERIVDPIINSKLNGFPNELLPDAVRLYQMQSTAVPKIIAIGGNTDKELAAKMDRMIESFENTKTSITLDKKGLAIQIDKMIQKRIERKRYTA